MSIITLFEKNVSIISEFPIYINKKRDLDKRQKTEIPLPSERRSLLEMDPHYTKYNSDCKHIIFLRKIKYR